MINPFTLSKNKRYLLNSRIIVIEDILQFNIIWYDLEEWWNKQNKNPNLYNSPLFWFIINAKNIK